MAESQANGANGGARSAELAAPSYPPPPPQPTITGAPQGAPAQPAAETRPAQAPLNTWGHNKRFGPRDVKRFILEGMQKLADQSGQQVPQDIVRFLDDAQIVYLDENSRPVSFERVVVTWEDK